MGRERPDEPGVRNGSPTFSKFMSFGIDGPKISRSSRPTEGRDGNPASPSARFTAKPRPASTPGEASALACQRALTRYCALAHAALAARDDDDALDAGQLALLRQPALHPGHRRGRVIPGQALQVYVKASQFSRLLGDQVKAVPAHERVLVAASRGGSGCEWGGRAGDRSESARACAGAKWAGREHRLQGNRLERSIHVICYCNRDGGVVCMAGGAVARCGKAAPACRALHGCRALLGDRKKSERLGPDRTPRGRLPSKPCEGLRHRLLVPLTHHPSMYRSRLSAVAALAGRQSRSLVSARAQTRLSTAAPQALRALGSPLSLGRLNAGRVACYSTETAEGEEAAKPGPVVPLAPLFTCTPQDSARLGRLRNVGISAHIDVSVVHHE